jgi:hypothetical protein
MHTLADRVFDIFGLLRRFGPKLRGQPFAGRHFAQVIERARLEHASEPAIDGDLIRDATCVADHAHVEVLEDVLGVGFGEATTAEKPCEVRMQT